jgi:phosphoribosyl 1,2-cyclic phosphodiesterase
MTIIIYIRPRYKAQVSMLSYFSIFKSCSLRLVPCAFAFFFYFCPMSIHVCSLNSGSNANCYYIGNSQEAVLIDAGLSCRETERRMKLSGLLMENVKALFISHEHTDHITGMAGIAKKFKLPVYVTDDTLRQSNMPVDPSLVRSFKHARPVRIGHFTITPFTKSHDAADPHSFIVSAYGINTGIITDIGYACKKVIKYFGQCHVAFLESNYCDDMLTNGSYPWHLKKRISGDEGHLSNAQALELFLHYRSPDLRLLILSHLSKNNNKPQLVEKMFTPHAGTTQIFIASRYEASPVFTIQRNDVAAVAKKISRKIKKDERQLSLF